MIEALLKAAARGVRVVVLVPGKIDHEITYRASRSNYGRMLLGNIQIFEYMVALLHAKTMVVDGVWASVGSTNFDNRSFALNEELNLTVYDAGIARRLEAAFEDDLRYARKISYEEWNSRGNASSSGSLFRFEITYDFGEDLKESVCRGSLNSQRLDAQPKASGTRISVSANKTSPITPGSRTSISSWTPASVNKTIPGILPITLARKKSQKRIRAAPIKKFTKVNGPTGNTRTVRTVRKPWRSAGSSTRRPQNRATLLTISCPIPRPTP
jgi:cardiolipin synthase